MNIVLSAEALPGVLTVYYYCCLNMKRVPSTHTKNMVAICHKNIEHAVPALTYNFIKMKLSTAIFNVTYYWHIHMIFTSLLEF